MKKLLCIVSIFSLFLYGGCSDSRRIVNIDSQGTTIVCFGDSITRGHGATNGMDYPSQLSHMLNLDVINAGKDGDTSRDALKRIEKDVLIHDPKIVIVEFSGNDFLKGLPKKETFENIEKIVEIIQEKGAMVVIAGIGAGYLRDEYGNGLARIAKKYGCLFMRDIMDGIRENPSLKSDAIHPNDRGYGIIADRLFKKIEPYLK